MTITSDNTPPSISPTAVPYNSPQAVISGMESYTNTLPDIDSDEESRYDNKL